MALIRTHRALHIAHRRTHYAYADLMKHGAGIHLGEFKGTKGRSVPGKTMRTSRSNRKKVADILRKRRAAGEYHRGL